MAWSFTRSTRCSQRQLALMRDVLALKKLQQTDYYTVTFAVAFEERSAASIEPQPPSTSPSIDRAHVASLSWNSQVNSLVGFTSQNQAWWQQGRTPKLYESYQPRDSGLGG